MRLSEGSCVGSDAKIGAPAFPLDFSRLDSGAVPSMRDFSWSICRPSAADSAKALTYDYARKTRNRAPSIGGPE